MKESKDELIMVTKKELEDCAYQLAYNQMTDARLIYDLMVGGRSNRHDFIMWYQDLVQEIWRDICEDEG